MQLTGQNNGEIASSAFLLARKCNWLARTCIMNMRNATCVGTQTSKVPSRVTLLFIPYTVPIARFSGDPPPPPKVTGIYSVYKMFSKLHVKSFGIVGFKQLLWKLLNFRKLEFISACCCSYNSNPGEHDPRKVASRPLSGP